jgi:hypothetical protein
METSFYGTNERRFEISDFHEIGADLLKTVFIYEKGNEDL